MEDMKKLRQKEEKELRKLLEEAKSELSKLKSSRALGSLSDTSSVGKKRKEIAQVLTLLREKKVLNQIEEESEGKE